MQAIQFVGISGIGWIIDFTIFNLLNLIFRNVTINNVISSGIAVCFVFMLSTRKTFVQKENGLNLKWKFVIYIIYQVVLILLMSVALAHIAEVLKVWLQGTFIVGMSAMISKILVTPFTMCLNFLVMKAIVEKI